MNPTIRCIKPTHRTLGRWINGLTLRPCDDVATYYVGSQLASTRGQTILAREEATKFDALDFAYGDSTKLVQSGPAGGPASRHPPTPANVRFQEAMRRAGERQGR